MSIIKNIKNKRISVQKSKLKSKEKQYFYQIYRFIDNYLITKIKELCYKKDPNLKESIKKNIIKILKIYGYSETSDDIPIILKSFINRINKHIGLTKDKIKLDRNIVNELTEYYYKFYKNESFNNYHFFSEYRSFLSNPIIDNLYKTLNKYYDNLPI